VRGATGSDRRADSALNPLSHRATTSKASFEYCSLQALRRIFPTSMFKP